LTAIEDHTSVAEILLEKGADIDHGNPSPLWHAVNNNNCDVVQLLLRRNASCNQKQADGLTPLELALAKEFDDVVKVFEPEFKSKLEFWKICLSFGYFDKRISNEFDDYQKNELFLCCLRSESKNCLKQFIDRLGTEFLTKEDVDRLSKAHRTIYEEIVLGKVNLSRQPMTRLQELSKAFPTFNEKIEDKTNVGRCLGKQSISLTNDLKPAALGPFCCVAPTKSIGGKK
jgi:hypothetical protein